MDIYIKPVKKAPISDRKEIYIKDVCKVSAEKNVADKVNSIKLLQIERDVDAKYLISVIDIIKAIKKSYPDYTVNNVGEMDTLVDYKPYKNEKNNFLKWLKITFITIVLVAGSATAIMSFHTDAQMPQVFKNYYKIFFGKESEKPLIIDIPYSIGLAVGIIVFFNHFAGKKLTDDPTPIEVEMSMYDTEVSDALIDTISAQQEEQGGGKK